MSLRIGAPRISAKNIALARMTTAMIAAHPARRADIELPSPVSTSDTISNRIPAAVVSDIVS